MWTGSAYFVVERSEEGRMSVCCWNQLAVFPGVVDFVLYRVSLFPFDWLGLGGRMNGRFLEIREQVLLFFFNLFSDCVVIGIDRSKMAFVQTRITPFSIAAQTIAGRGGSGGRGGQGVDFCHCAQWRAERDR